MLDDPQDLQVQVPHVRIIKARLAPCLRERLAREARAKDIVLGYLPRVYFTDVRVALYTEISLVKRSEGSVDLAGEYAPVPEAAERKMKPAEPGKQINEPHSTTALPPIRSKIRLLSCLYRHSSQEFLTG